MKTERDRAIPNPVVQMLLTWAYFLIVAAIGYGVCWKVMQPLDAAANISLGGADAATE